MGRQANKRIKLTTFLRNEDGITERSDFLRSMMMPKGGDGIKSMVGSLQRFGAGRLVRCTKGISSVEFVIVLPLFVLFTFGIIGFSAISFAHNNMVNAAREATRRMSVADGVDCSVGGALGSCVTLRPLKCGVDPIAIGSAEEIACTYLADWALLWTVTAQELVNNACDSTMQVGITTSAEDAFIIDFMGFFAPADLLSVEVSMRKELEARCVL